MIHLFRSNVDYQFLLLARALLPSIIGFISPINLSLFTILRRTTLIDSSETDSKVKV